MAGETPKVLEAPRLPELCRKVCLFAGIPAASEPGSEEWFVLRSGREPPDFFAKLLEEAVLEDEAEAVVHGAAGAPDDLRPGAGRVAVRSGFDSPCLVVEELRRAMRPGDGRLLVFAVERHDAGGRLLGVTWVGLPEDEPPPNAPFRAVVVRHDAPVCQTGTAPRARCLHADPVGLRAV